MPPLSPAIRYASVDDAPALAGFAASAFSDTYGALHDPQEIADYISGHFSRAAICSVIANPAGATLLVETAGQLAGYAVVEPGEPPPCVTGPGPIELARFYLGREFTGWGLGAALMRAVHAEARRLGFRTIWLGVYERNVRAVRFYERLGFTRSGDREFVFGGRRYVDPVYSAPVRAEADGALSLPPPRDPGVRK